MPAKNKKSKKAKQPTEEQIIVVKVLDTMGAQRLLQYLVVNFENRINDIGTQIESELKYAKWETKWDNVSDAKQIKAYAKLLGKEVKSYEEMIKLLQKVSKAEIKSREVW
jgi:hypothetical protein